MIFDVHVTTRCNLKCKHCYLRGIKERGDMSLETFADTLIDASLNVGTIILSGGEPLYHKNFLELIEAYRLYYNSVAMATNGTLLTEYIDIFNKNDRGIQISLDGDRDFHDFLRGEGVYDSVIQGIEELINKGIIPSLAFTVFKENVYCAEHIINICKKYNIKLVNVNLYMPIVSNEVNPVSFGEFFKIREKFKREGIRVSHPCYINKCIAGNRVISVLPDGRRVACSRFMYEGYKSDGNMFKTCMHNYPMPIILKKLEEEIIKRLKQVEDINPKWLVYGGDFGADLLLYYAERFFDNFKLVVPYLPCQSKDLQNFIERRVKCLNAEIYRYDKCNPFLLENVLVYSACKNFVKIHDSKNGLVVRGCFVGESKEYIANLGNCIKLWLFGGMSKELCQLLYFWNTRNDPQWHYWRSVLCAHGLSSKERIETIEKMKSDPITPSKLIKLIAEVENGLE